MADTTYVSIHSGLEIDNAINTVGVLEEQLEVQNNRLSFIEEQIQGIMPEEAIDEKIKAAIDIAIWEAIGGNY